MDLLQFAATVLLATTAGAILYRSLASKVRTPNPRAAPLPPLGSGLPLIGDTFLHISKGPRAAGTPHNVTHGSIYRTWFVGERVIHVGDVDAVRYLLNAEHDLVEGDWPSNIRQLLGNKGIPTLHGPQHVQARRMISAALTPKASVAYIPRIVQLAQSLCAEWAVAQHVKAFDSMKTFAFQVATELLVGFPADFINKELLDRQHDLWSDWLGGFLALPINLPGFAFHKAMLARKALLAEYELNIRRLKDKSIRPTEGSPKPAMQYFLEACESGDTDLNTIDVFRDVAFTLLFAGHDTSAAALTMMLRYLKLEPRVLQQLRNEQLQVVAQVGPEIDSTALAQMPYADATIKEVLRFETIVPEVYRRALKTFECGGYTFPKGHKMALELFRVVQEDPRWVGAGPDLVPTKFNPDRWLSEEGRRAGSWMPFGSGPRMCLGYVFALQEIKIMLAVLVRGYDWHVDLDEPIKSFPIPAPTRGMPMIFNRI